MKLRANVFVSTYANNSWGNRLLSQKMVTTSQTAVSSACTMGGCASSLWLFYRMPRSAGQVVRDLDRQQSLTEQSLILTCRCTPRSQHRISNGHSSICLVPPRPVHSLHLGLWPPHSWAENEQRHPSDVAVRHQADTTLGTTDSILKLRILCTFFSCHLDVSQRYYLDLESTSGMNFCNFYWFPVRLHLEKALMEFKHLRVRLLPTGKIFLEGKRKQIPAGVTRSTPCTTLLPFPRRSLALAESLQIVPIPIAADKRGRCGERPEILFLLSLCVWFWSSVLHTASQRRNVTGQLHPFVCSWGEGNCKAVAKLWNVSTERWNLPLLHLEYRTDNYSGLLVLGNQMDAHWHHAFNMREKCFI